MSGNNVNFRHKNIKKSNFYKNKKVIKIDDIDVNPIQDGPFWGCSQMGGGGQKSPAPLKICHTYPTMIKLGTLLYLI